MVDGAGGIGKLITQHPLPVVLVDLDPVKRWIADFEQPFTVCVSGRFKFEAQPEGGPGVAEIQVPGHASGGEIGGSIGANIADGQRARCVFKNLRMRGQIKNPGVRSE